MVCIFVIVQVIGYTQSNSDNYGYMYTVISVLVSVPKQTQLLVNIGVVLTAALQGFAGINLFFLHIFDPLFGIELLDEELDFSVSRAPREKRVENLISILNMIAKGKMKLQKLKLKKHKLPEDKESSFIGMFKSVFQSNDDDVSESKCILKI